MMKLFNNMRYVNYSKILGLSACVTVLFTGVFTHKALLANADTIYYPPASLVQSDDNLDKAVPIFTNPNNTSSVSYITQTFQPKVKSYKEYKEMQNDTIQQQAIQQKVETTTNTYTQDIIKEDTLEQESILSDNENINSTKMEQANKGFILCLQSYGIATPNYIQSVSKYSDLMYKYSIENSGKYLIPSIMIECMSLQESNDNPMASNGHAGGLLQIEDTNLADFKKYSINKYNQYWVEQDRFHVEKNIDYACHKVGILLDLYEGDYVKALQAYNYSQFSLNKLISVYGDNWFTNRDQMARLNNRSRYGDPIYVEHAASKLSI